MRNGFASVCGLLVLSSVASGSASVRVTSDRPSQVYVDGEMVGSAPLSISQLPSGKHTIEVRESGTGTSRVYDVVSPKGIAVEKDLDVRFERTVSPPSYEPQSYSYTAPPASTTPPRGYATPTYVAPAPVYATPPPVYYDDYDDGDVLSSALLFSLPFAYSGGYGSGCGSSYGGYGYGGYGYGGGYGYRPYSSGISLGFNFGGGRHHGWGGGHHHRHR